MNGRLLPTVGLLFVLLVASALPSAAQSNPPPANYFRSYVSDVPERPLITVTVTGAVGVACFTIEEQLPATTTPQAIGGSGQYLPGFQSIRWGPFTNQTSASVSYRLTGQPGTYPVNGGAWMDGRWFFSPPETQVPIFGPGTVLPVQPSQVATPVLTPAGGAVVPTNLTMTCATPGAAIRYTLDGTVPTAASPLYGAPLALTQAVVVRARGFTNGYDPSPVNSQSYAPPLTNGSLTVVRSVNTNLPSSPVMQITATATGARCFAIEERLPVGLPVANVSAGGTFLQPEAVLRWGPFTETNIVILSYQIAGPSGSYPVRASWSVDGMAGGETTGTNIFVAATGSDAPSPPPQVATPVFTPAEGSNLPVAFSLTCATPGAQIRFTFDGTVPQTNSALYAGPVQVTSNATVRARAFTNGWLDSPASVASFGVIPNRADAQVARSVDNSSPTNPLVTLTMTAGSNASCLAVTEWLPLGLAPTQITGGGNYLANSNVVVWGPFFGSNIPPFSYRAAGRSGTYQTVAVWSVDGVSATGAASSVSIAPSPADALPTQPSQVPAPVLTPASASNLPVVVSIASPDPAAQVYFTTDGTLPTTNAALYGGPIPVNTPTTLRARAFRAGYLDSVAVAGNYWVTPTTNGLTLVRSLQGNVTFIPTVTIAATPSAGVACYSVTERIPPGVLPIDSIPAAAWDADLRVLRWGPFQDHQPRSLSYGLLADWSGGFPLEGEGSFDGFRSTVAGASSVTVNLQYSGSLGQQATNCFTDVITYSLDFMPATNAIVTNVFGFLDWGDGTQSVVTNKTMNLQKVFTAPGTYSVVLSVDWKGLLVFRSPDGSATNFIPYQAHAVQSNTVTAVGACLPVIVSQPQPTNQSAWAGATIQISMTASSAFPMTYQWHFNGTNPIVSPGIFNILTLPNVRPEASGLYSVIVTNFYGSVTSQTARLLVAEPQVAGISRNSNGTFTLNFSGLPNTATRTWAATNLIPPIFWESISTNNSGSSGTWQVTDSKATNFPTRFYRFSAP